MTKSIFERIIDREIPANILHEDEHCIAFKDIRPAAPTHLLVVPKRKMEMIEHMTSDDKHLVGHLTWVATQVAQNAGLNDGYRLVINNGNQGGQTVFHLHIHVLGGRDLTWPPG